MYNKTNYSTGIIVEYNPFHNGHKLHLENSRKQYLKTESKEDINNNVIIAVMSGDYLQRGEPALINRWKRTEVALLEGVDIVVELPAFYSTQSAEIFATSALKILNHLGANRIVFGSESNDINKLKKIASFEESQIFENNLKKKLKQGFSFASAYYSTLNKYNSIPNLSNSSNDILAVEYIKAINKNNLNIIPISIQREQNSYHSSIMQNNINSATSIRKEIQNICNIILPTNDLTLNNNLNKIKNTVPKTTFEIIKNALTNSSDLNFLDNTEFMTLEKYYPLIRHEIILHPEKLQNIQDLEVGYENKLYKAAIKHHNFKFFFNDILSKRYTIGRTQRILTHIVIGLTQDITKIALEEIPYIRILGFNNKGKEYIAALKNICTIPILTTLKNYPKILDKKAAQLLEFNELSSYIYQNNTNYYKPTKPIIILEPLPNKI